ncbi:MAG: hypothetical protein ACTSR8_07955 [Promethearchaeota archaeon]
MEPKPPEKPLEEKKTELPKLQVVVPPPQKAPNENKPSEKEKSKNRDNYTSRQKTTATILYISIVVATIITIIGVIWAIADIFMISGKLNAFLSLSFGFQIAIVGGFAAGFFFILTLFIALSKKGVKIITKITFKPREIEEKYQNKTIVKIFAGAIMFSIFAIIIGIIISLILEVIGGSTGEFSFTTITSTFDSTGPFVLFIGIFLLIMNALAFSLNWLWYNGYYFLLRLVTDLEKAD